MSLESEQSILGCMLINKDTVPETMGMLSADDFENPGCRTVFEAIYKQFLSDGPIDPIVILNMMEFKDEYKPFLVMLTQIVPTTSNFRSYAQITSDDAKKRRAALITTELIDTFRFGTVEDCQELASSICESLGDKRNDRTVTALQGLVNFFVSKQQPREYQRTGISFIDRVTHIEPGDFIVIGGRPSSGKTAITIQMALDMAERYKVVYFSLETNSSKFYDRAISNAARVSLGDIKNGTLNYDKVAAMSNKFKSLKLTLVEAAGWTVSQIKAKAIQLGAEVIFIDYFSLIKGEGKSMLEKVTGNSIALHTLAQQSKMTTIALSQLNRDGSEEPTMKSLRESGQIEQDADIIILLHEVVNDTLGSENNDRKLIIAKNKEGLTGAKMFKFTGEYQEFTEIVYV